MAELIHVEMDLRVSSGDIFRKNEFEKRFPDHEIAVEKAWRRLGELYSGAELFSTVLACTNKSGSGPGTNSPFKSGATRRRAVPVVFGPFTNIEILAEGGFGVVCRALDKRNDEWVALKFPHQDVLCNDRLLQQFQEEANRVLPLRHKGIVEVRSFELHEDHVAIAMQLIEGSTLKATIAKEQTKCQIVELIAKIADSLAYAHRQGVIHRDLKPANILLDQKGEPLITDFGLSIHENDQAFFPNEQCGTPPYMSPQLVEGLTRNLDGRTDIWSLGVILYELLAGKRPFCGVSRQDIFDQIQSRDPKPLRELNPTVDHELQRICLKCLARPARDRYMTADELAEDLRYWLNSDSSGSTQQELIANVVPKGLRSYEMEDSAFYLDLLPGPRDRNGTPTSVKFWLQRLNKADTECEPMPIGVIYGPSGSGKSSLVKAAILPLLSKTLRVVFVESTQQDTEVRLLKTIRRVFPSVPKGLALPKLLRGLARGLWNPKHLKIIIVLDQFEQRLSVNDSYVQSQLAKALRHCDGVGLQCLLVVRDSFWLSLTRFTDALEMDLLEGRNCQSTDLFDKKHARKVLHKLGQGLGTLPAATDPPSDLQNQFLDMTIDQLASNELVVCVQLAVFAEMFKTKSWDPSELDAVGGVAGAGECFLDYHFGDNSAHPRLRFRQKQAVLVLEALLPDPDSDIRGTLVSESRLMKASGCQEKATIFNEVIRILDDELRLISKTHPDNGIQECHPNVANGNLETHYQLTHDYLVPSIRNWLDQVCHQTAKGRTRSRFTKLAKSWKTNRDDRFLPTLMEYVSAIRYLKIQELSPIEKSLLQKANRYYLFRFVFFVLIASTLCWSWVSSRNKDIELARSHVISFLADQPEAVPSNITLMHEHRRMSLQILYHLQASTSRQEKARHLRIQIGLAYLGEKDPELVQSLVDSVSETNDNEGRNILASLRTCRLLSVPLLKRRFRELVNEHNKLRQINTQLTEDIFTNRAILARLAVLLVATNSLETVEPFATSETNRVFRLELVRAFAIWADIETLQSAPYKMAESEIMQGSLILGYGNFAWKNQSMEIPISVLVDVNSFCRSSMVPFVQASNQWLQRVTHSGLHGPNDWNMVKVDLEKLKFRMLDREIAIGDFRDFLNDATYPDNDKPLGPINLANQDNKLPMHDISKIDAILYCNWRSYREGKDTCYVRIDKQLNLPPMPEEFRAEYIESTVDNRLDVWKFLPSANGYRLPTREEWDVAAEFSEFIKLADAEDERYLPDIAWYNKQTFEYGRQKMPNENGFFDMYGNTNEVCWRIQQLSAESKFLLSDRDAFRGGGIEHSYNEVVHKGFDFPPFLRKVPGGFRVAQNLD